MGRIITMNSKEFIKDFVSRYDTRKFQYVLVSDDIRTNGKKDNVYALGALIPPPDIVSIYVNKGICDKYKQKYFEYLSEEKVENLLTIMVKLCAIDNTDVIILCSDDETKYKYMEMISEYMETIYHIKVFKYKKIKKDLYDHDSIKESKKTMKVLKKKLPRIKNVNKKSDEDLVIEYLSAFTTKELKTICKKQGIKVKKDYSRKDIINKLKTKVLYE